MTLTVEKLATEWLDKARSVEKNSPEDRHAEAVATAGALRYCAAEVRRLDTAKDAQQSPSYEALLLIVQSVSGALERAGVTDCDDPGEAIDVLLAKAPPPTNDAKAIDLLVAAGYVPQATADHAASIVASTQLPGVSNVDLLRGGEKAPFDAWWEKPNGK